MKVAAMFFAESAEHVKDRLRVEGGLWDGVAATRFPASHSIPVVLVLQLEPADVGQSYHLDLHVTGPGGVEVGHEHADVTVNVHRQQTAVVVTVPATFTQEGPHAVELRSRIAEQTVTFQVVLQGGGSLDTAVEGYALGLGK